MEGLLMRYALIEDNTVVQIDCNPRDGFIEVEDSVVCGMLLEGSTFTNPTPPTTLLAEQAKVDRDAIIESNINVNGVEWQVDRLNDEPRIKRAVRVAEFNDLPDTTELTWILADNSLRTTTIAELKVVLTAKAYREKDVFAQYTQWRAGSMATKFKFYDI
jgi:hypothetical protein